MLAQTQSVVVGEVGFDADGEMEEAWPGHQPASAREVNRPDLDSAGNQRLHLRQDRKVEIFGGGIWKGRILVNSNSESFNANANS